MATGYYKLPTVDPDSTLSFPDAVNGLAIATDDVLQDVQDGFGHMDVTDLPTASTKEVGVVRIGDGFRTYADGTLVTSKPPFKLKPAKQDTLGGIYIGDNIDVEKDGTISINMGAFNVDSISGASIDNGAVTTEKIAPYAVDDKKIGGSIVNDINKVENLFTNAEGFSLGDYYLYYGFCKVVEIASNLFMLYTDFSQQPTYSPFWRDGTDTKNYQIKYVPDKTGSPVRDLQPAERFTGDITVSAFCYKFLGSTYKLVAISTVTFHGATAKLDRKITKITGDTPTHYFVPPTIISL